MIYSNHRMPERFAAAVEVEQERLEGRLEELKAEPAGRLVVAQLIASLEEKRRAYWRDIMEAYFITISRGRPEFYPYLQQELKKRGLNESSEMAVGILKIIAEASDRQDALTAEEIFVSMGYTAEEMRTNPQAIGNKLRTLHRLLEETQLELVAIETHRGDARNLMKKVPAYRLRWKAGAQATVRAEPPERKTAPTGKESARPPSGGPRTELPDRAALAGGAPAACPAVRPPPPAAPTSPPPPAAAGSGRPGPRPASVVLGPGYQGGKNEAGGDRTDWRVTKF